MPTEHQFAMTTTTAMAIGCIYLAWQLLQLLLLLFTMLRPACAIRSRFGAQWAVVTGVADGIGKAMAMELAARGVNLVLVGQNEAELDIVVAEVSAKYWNVEVRCETVADFTAVSAQELATNLDHLQIGVLVNHVGVSCGPPSYFHELDDQDIDTMLRTNTCPVVWLTRALCVATPPSLHLEIMTNLACLWLLLIRSNVCSQPTADAGA